MPTISMFYGIVIRMYWNDHMPPHFHALYQDYKASFDFEGNLREGEMPPKQCKLIAAWAVIHMEELRANWILAESKETLYRIDPLS